MGVQAEHGGGEGDGAHLLVSTMPATLSILAGRRPATMKSAWQAGGSAGAGRLGGERLPACGGPRRLRRASRRPMRTVKPHAGDVATLACALAHQLSVQEGGRHAKGGGHAGQRHALVRLEELGVRRGACLTHVVPEVGVQVHVGADGVHQPRKRLQGAGQCVQDGRRLCTRDARMTWMAVAGSGGQLDTRLGHDCSGMLRQLGGVLKFRGAKEGPGTSPGAGGCRRAAVERCA